VLVYSDGSCKISNFGFSREVPTPDTSYRGAVNDVIPLRWAAPEVQVDNIFSSASDVWSFGVLCFEVLSDGTEPYADWSTTDVITHTRLGKGPGCPSTANKRFYSSIVEPCFRKEPSARIKIGTIVVSLKTLLPATRVDAKSSVGSLTLLPQPPQPQPEPSVVHEEPGLFERQGSLRSHRSATSSAHTTDKLSTDSPHRKSEVPRRTSSAEHSSPALSRSRQTPVLPPFFIPESLPAALAASMQPRKVSNPFTGNRRRSLSLSSGSAPRSSFLLHEDAEGAGRHSTSPPPCDTSSRSANRRWAPQLPTAAVEYVLPDDERNAARRSSQAEATLLKSAGSPVELRLDDMRRSSIVSSDGRASASVVVSPFARRSFETDV
jgi:hypothetical protein